MKHLLLSLAAAALVLSQPAALKAESAGPPVVIELFTSQGCYSCPPADRLLGELAKEEGLVAIGYHVNYWDRLGWPDPFATKWGTDRQYGYAQAQRSRQVYTPQMIVDGARHTVGSDERRVRGLIRRARDNQKPASPALSWADGRTVRIALPAAPDAKGAEIWLIRFDEKQTTHIVRGENGGKRLAYHHVARARQALGRFSGAAHTIEAKVQPSDSPWGVAVLVQESGPGKIWGAAALTAPQ